MAEASNDLPKIWSGWFAIPIEILARILVWNVWKGLVGSPPLPIKMAGMPSLNVKSILNVEINMFVYLVMKLGTLHQIKPITFWASMLIYAEISSRQLATRNLSQNFFVTFGTLWASLAVIFK